MRVLDLFSGIGGFSIGLERAGFETVAFCEIEEYPRKILKQHWPHVPIYDDVRTLTAEKLHNDGITVDVICGGFPCQDLSVAGKQAGIEEGTRSGLWSECARLLGEIRPRYAIFENVTALLSGDNGRWFQRVLGDISALGYDAEWRCFRAAEFGLPHRRDRVFILAHAKHLRRDAGYTRNARPKKSKRRADRLVTHRRAGLYATPRVCRVANGLPNRAHRLKALGNAVVPQIPELIGRAINEAR